MLSIDYKVISIMKFCFLIDNTNVTSFYRSDEYLIKVLSSYGDIVFLHNDNLSENFINYHAIDVIDKEFDQKIKSIILSDVRFFVYLTLDVIGPLGKNLTDYLSFIENNSSNKIVYMTNGKTLPLVIGFARDMLPKIFSHGRVTLNSLENTFYIENSFDEDTAYTNPIEIIHKLPFLSKQFFSRPYSDLIENGRGNQKIKILDYLRNNNYYPIEFIWQFLLKTKKLSDLRLEFNLVLPLSSKTIQTPIDFAKEKIAILVYLYYDDCYENILNRLKGLHSNIKVVIVSPKSELIDKACQYLIELGLDVAQLRKRPSKFNRGRDLVSFLTVCPLIFNKFDYVCVLHDKKSTHLKSKNLAEEFLNHCLDSLLINTTYISNVINCLKTKNCLGMLVPPSPTFANLFFTDQLSVATNYEHMNKLYEMLSLSIPFDNYPVAPYGSMFWVKSRAMKPLFRHKWINDDFPEEPIEADGTILHAIERIIPLVIQESGYYVSYVGDYDAIAASHTQAYYAMREIVHEEYLQAKRFRLSDILSVLKRNNAILVKRLKSKVFYYSLFNTLTLNRLGFLKHRLKGLKFKLNIIKHYDKKPISVPAHNTYNKS